MTRISENTGWRMLKGHYFVFYEITDGDLGASLADAINEQAIETGWQQTLHEQRRNAVELRYERDDFSALIYVFTDREPVSASLSVRRTADSAAPSATAR